MKGFLGSIFCNLASHLLGESKKRAGCRSQRRLTSAKNASQGSPFLKCVVSIWALSVRGGGVVKACQDGLGHFFFHVFPFDRGGGSKASYLGNAHIEPTQFKKGLPSEPT